MNRIKAKHSWLSPHKQKAFGNFSHHLWFKNETKQRDYKPVTDGDLHTSEMAHNKTVTFHIVEGENQLAQIVLSSPRVP